MYRQYHIIYKVTLAFALLVLIDFRKYIFEITVLNNFRNNNFGRFVLKLITNYPCSSYHIFSCKLSGSFSGLHHAGQVAQEAPGPPHQHLQAGLRQAGQLEAGLGQAVGQAGYHEVVLGAGCRL